MGYFGYSYYDENKDKLKALQVTEPEDGPVRRPRPSRRRRTTRTSRSPDRSSSTRRAPSFKRKEVQSFFAFIFANEKAIATRADFVPLTAAQLKRAKTSTSILAVKAANKLVARITPARTRGAAARAASARARWSRRHRSRSLDTMHDDEGSPARRVLHADRRARRCRRAGGRARDALQGARRPAPVKILNCLARAGGERDLRVRLQPPLGLKQPTVSYHLKLLTDAGLLHREKRGSLPTTGWPPGALERLGDLVAAPPALTQAV